MSLQTLSLLENSTVAASGGTALALVSAGGSLGKNRLIPSDDTDLRTQRVLDLSAQLPRPQASAPNGYTQGRASTVFKFPLLLDNGEITVNKVTISMSCDVETTVTEKTEYLSLACQTAIDAEMAQLWNGLNAG